MAIELNTPQDLYSVVGIKSYTLDDDYILGAHIDFRNATFGDGSPAWFDQERPYSEYGSGRGILKWTPRLFDGRFLRMNISQWKPNYMWYMQGELVAYQGSFYKCLVWDTWEPPTNAAHWQIVEQWSESVSYGWYDIVEYDGKLWESWANNPQYPPGYPLDYDWYEIPMFSTSASPVNFIPYNLDEVNLLEDYMGIGSDNPIGSWGGMLPFGAYRYATGSSSAYFYGTFNFNGKCIKNMYMDYRGLESDSVVNNRLYNNGLKAFVSRFRASDDSGYDKFAGSRPHFINPCIIAQWSSSVLYVHDTDSNPDYFPTRPVITGGVKIENPFVLNETLHGSIVSNHMKYAISGPVELEDIRLVNLQLYEEGSAVLGIIAANCSVGDSLHTALMGDTKISGSIFCKKLSNRTGSLFGDVSFETGETTSNLVFGNIEIDVDIEAEDVASRADKYNTAALETSNPGEVGLLIGRCCLDGGNISFGNLSLSGSLVVNTQSQYVSDISALVGKIEGPYTITLGKTVINAHLATDSADKYLVCTDNVLGIINIGDLYFNTTLADSFADEIGIGLTSDQMRKTTSFNLLDLKHTWQMAKGEPVIRELTEKIKTNTTVKNLYTGI